MLLSIAFLITLFYSGYCTNRTSGDPLGPYKISDITVSGISAGGFMAVQLHVAFSSIISGCAAFAAGPYFCAENNVASAEYKCMKTYYGPPDTAYSISVTETYENTFLIDKTRNLQDDKVYIFSGKEDSVVNSVVVNALMTYYKHYIDNYNIVADFSIPAEHCFPTLNYGEECATLALPYIGKCGFDGAKAAFSTLFGSLKPKVAQIASNLLKFNQIPYWPDTLTSLADNGYIYVPTACQNGQQTCRLHISLHGCQQTESIIGNDYASKIGMNEWAESNNIIVLYPYVKVSPGVPLNPNGCWDWWGYTNIYYASNIGKQMVFIRDLIKAITGK